MAELPDNIEFRADLSKFARAMNAEVKETVLKVAFTLFGKIVVASPVDTGAYRASHQIAINNPSESVVKPEKGKKFQKRGATTRAMKQTKKLKNYDLQDIIWISNNLPYAVRIEHGWSKEQAPKGVYGLSIQVVENDLQKELANIKIPV